jgi:hypothetical protein
VLTDLADEYRRLEAILSSLTCVAEHWARGLDITGPLSH